MIKQVIIIRKDLKMRRGKEIAQGAHASMKWLAEVVTNYLQSDPDFPQNLYLTKEQEEWLRGRFTKICLQVNSEAELLEIAERAKSANLTVSLIQDAGATEFNGVPTYTSVAIGPNEAEAIDKITSSLTLY